MKRFFTTMIIAAALLFSVSCVTTDTKSYRTEMIGKTNFAINLPKDMENFTIKYFEYSSTVPLAQLRSGMILYLKYDNPEQENDYYGMIVFFSRSCDHKILFFEHCVNNECKYWAYKDRIPYEATKEDCKKILQEFMIKHNSTMSLNMETMNAIFR